jgi:hypothetical protein
MAGLWGEIDDELPSLLSGRNSLLWLNNINGGAGDSMPSMFPAAAATATAGPRRAAPAVAGWATSVNRSPSTAPIPAQAPAMSAMQPKEGLLGGLEDRILSPLFLGGAALLSGEGMGGALRGMQVGGGFQDQRRQLAEQERQKQQFQGLLADPSVTGALPAPMLKIAEMAGPTSGPEMLGKWFDPNREVDLALKRAQTQKYLREASDAGATFGKSGNIFQDPTTGQFYSVQFGSNGQKLVEPIGGGLTPSRGVGEVDTGTGTEIIDKATGRTIRSVGKDVFGLESAKAQGKGQGEATVALPTIEATADRALKTIGQIRNHPGKQYGTGAAGVLPGVPGTWQKGFVTLVDQAKGQTFLEAFNSLRGGGAITEAEGRKATEAFARLDRAQRAEDFDAALSDLEAVIKEGVRVARAKAAAGGGGAPAAPAPPANGGWSIQRVD